MIILDVREKEEFEAEHVPDSICCPLSQFDTLAPGILKNLKDSDVVIMCRTGNRAKMAMNELKKLELNIHKFKVYEGGILKWKNENKPIRGKGSVFPIMRQVQIVASSLIFLAFLGQAFIAPSFIYLALFVGGGLAVAGWSGLCPMIFILQKMPWNNRKMSDNPDCGEKSKAGSCC